MTRPTPSHALLMIDEVGSRSFSRIEGTQAHARTVAQFIADRLGFRVRLESDGDVECVGGMAA